MEMRPPTLNRRILKAMHHLNCGELSKPVLLTDVISHVRKQIEETKFSEGDNIDESYIKTAVWRMCNLGAITYCGGNMFAIKTQVRSNKKFTDYLTSTDDETECQGNEENISEDRAASKLEGNSDNCTVVEENDGVNNKVDGYDDAAESVRIEGEAKHINEEQYEQMQIEINDILEDIEEIQKEQNNEEQSKEMAEKENNIIEDSESQKVGNNEECKQIGEETNNFIEHINVIQEEKIETKSNKVESL